MGKVRVEVINDYIRFNMLDLHKYLELDYERYYGDVWVSLEYAIDFTYANNIGSLKLTQELVSKHDEIFCEIVRCRLAMMKDNIMNALND